MNKEDKERVAAALTAKGATRPCARCGFPNFSIEAYFSHPVLESISEVGALRVGGMQIPTVVVACGKCGALTEYALGTLGLLPPRPQPGVEKK